MSRGSTLFTFLAGAAVGALAGILYAPDTGVNTRDKLTYRLGKYKEMLEDLLNDIADGEDLGLSTARSDGEKVVNSAKEKAEQLLTDVDALLGQIKSKEEKPK